jgi:hypothetical protein
MQLIPAWLLSSISDGEGNTSVGRLIALSISMVCVILPMIVWAFLSLLGGHMLDIPGSLTGFMGASGGLATALYAITKSKE